MIESNQEENVSSEQKKLQSVEISNEVSGNTDSLSETEVAIQNKNSSIKETVNDENKSDLNSSCINNINVNNINDNKNSTVTEDKNLKNSSESNEVNINSNNNKDTDENENNNVTKNDVIDTEKNKDSVKEDSQIESNIQHEVPNAENTENLENNVINIRKENKTVGIATETNLTKSIEVTEKHLNKTKCSNVEIINGLELIVECASDQEFCEEIQEERIKPRLNTIIVREKANDSEVEASSSEAEKLDSYKVVEAKSKITTTSTIKKTKKRGRKKSTLSKKITSDSENSTESNSDEDYSPIARKKVKKFVAKKTSVKFPEVKRGRGRPRGRPPKIRRIEREIPNNESEKIEIFKQNIDKRDNKHMCEESKESKNVKVVEVSKNVKIVEVSKNESPESEEIFDDSNDSNDSDSTINENGRKLSQRNIKKIDKLKKFIRIAGIKVQCYQTLLKDCKTDAAKAKCLHEFLEYHGIVGRPTVDKCKKLKMKNDAIKEAKELDTKSIFSESRSTRGKNT